MKLSATSATRGVSLVERYPAGSHRSGKAHIREIVQTFHTPNRSYGQEGGRNKLSRPDSCEMKAVKYDHEAVRTHRDRAQCNTDRCT